MAARCCAHLLNAAGFDIAMDAVERPKLPAILVGEPTQQLMTDVFGQRHLFDGLPRIEKRVVAWGGEAVTVPHRAVVVSEEVLAGKLGLGGKANDPPAWTVYASRPLPESCEDRTFGARLATAHAATLRGNAAALWIESVSAGWLFLLSAGGRAGWLLSVGGAADSLLGESGLIAPFIDGLGDPAGTFPAHPRMASPLCGRGWLSCGTAALSFDPICGDGTGYAIREGILAAAVIRAADRGEDEAALRSHYRNRILAAFQRHLELCRAYYRTGGSGPWWQGQLEALEEGVRWCRSALAGEVFRYRLKGFELERAG
ncbi:MAG TPA: hypothetical protein VMH28_04185 [Candidatus Acidoferrales bacterium]|nr:hypothetical protein [Candidatus Acidoferrales bacterium]